MNLTVHFFEIRDRAELESAFSEMAKAHVDALLVSEDPTLMPDTVRQLWSLRPSTDGRRPDTGRVAEAGGLIGYGVDGPSSIGMQQCLWTRSSKARNPADLPIEQPTKFDLVINLKTAKALGITIPQSLLLRADEVIQ